MEGFKTLPKGVQCFKEGGSVYKSRHSEKSEKKSDIAQDKSIVKKGVKQHEAALHKGQPKTELKLKQGGRTKKAVGTVKKYKCGGGVYGAKKTKEDIKNIDAAKECKPKKLQAGGMSAPAGPMAKAPSAAMGQMTELEKRRNLEKMKRAQQYLSPSQQAELIKQDPRAAGLTGNIGYKKGGKVKKCAEGGRFNSIDDDVRARAMKFIADGAQQNTETAETPVKPVKAAKPVRRAKAAKLPLPDYSNEDLDRMDAQIAEKTRRSKRTPRQMLEEESEYTIKPDLQVKGERLMQGYGMKKGGKVKKCNEGGSLKAVDAEENPGLAKLPTNVRNKMGYMRNGGKAKKMMTGGTCS
jgi:hypothetical protein